MVKNPPAMRETQVPSLGWEDPLQEKMGTHTSSSIFACRIPMDRWAWWATGKHTVVLKGPWDPPRRSTKSKLLWYEFKDSLFSFYMGLPLLLFSYPVVSDSLGPRGLQHYRLPCPSLSPGVCSDSCPVSRWCYLTILSSAAPPPLLFLPSIFPSIRVFFPVSQLFTSSGQSIGASASEQSFQWILKGWISQETTWSIITQRLGADTRTCLLLSQILVRFPQQWKQYKTMPEKNSIFKLCFKNLIIFIKEMWLMVTGNEVPIFNY